MDEATVPGPVAVVDIGSGSVKLLIADRAGLDGATGGTLFTASVKTRLLVGDGLHISDAALTATREAFAGFAAQLAAHRSNGPMPIRVVATAVAREASNRSALQALVTEFFGTDMEILTGPQEAEFAFLGATDGRGLAGVATVMDIGAGSTEFAFGTTGEPPTGFSLPIGARNLTDLYLLGDPPRPEELSSALSVMELHLDDLRRELPEIIEALEHGPFIAAGAMGQIASVEIGHPDPDTPVDGEIIHKSGVEELFRALATESAEERKHNPGLKPDDVDGIVGAICVLVEFLRQLGVEEVLVSERSVRHGVSVEMLSGR